MTRDFDTNLGLFSFDPDGEVIFEPVIPIVKDSTVLRMDVDKSCGCNVARVQGIVSAPGVPINVITDAIKEMRDTTIVPQCECGIDSEERQKAIIKKGFKLLEGAVDRAGEPTVQ